MSNPFRDLPSMTKSPRPRLRRAGEQASAFRHRRRRPRVLDALPAPRLVAGEVQKICVDTLAAEVLALLEAQAAPTIRTVINATGVVLHTNLGRSPIHENARSGRLRSRPRVPQPRTRPRRPESGRTARTPCARVEGRSPERRAEPPPEQLRRSDCHRRASAWRRSKEVIVSRGQLVEIGGSFRIPEVMAVSAALRESRHHNITRLSDYERAHHPEHRRGDAGSLEQLSRARSRNRSNSRNSLNLAISTTSR